jgi:hypothetical protein
MDLKSIVPLIVLTFVVICLERAAAIFHEQGVQNQRDLRVGAVDAEKERNGHVQTNAAAGASLERPRRNR